MSLPALPTISVYPPGAGTAEWNGADQNKNPNAAKFYYDVCAYGLTATPAAGYVFAHWEWTVLEEWWGATSNSTAVGYTIPEGSCSTTATANRSMTGDDFLQCVLCEKQTFEASLASSSGIYLTNIEEYSTVEGIHSCAAFRNGLLKCTRYLRSITSVRAVFWPTSKIDKLIYDPTTNKLMIGASGDKLLHYPNRVK